MAASENEFSHRSSDNTQKSRTKRGKETNGKSAQRRENGEGSEANTLSMTVTRPSSIPDLYLQKFEDGHRALAHISGILHYAKKYEPFLEDSDQFLGLCVKQDEEMEKLKSRLDTMTFFATNEVEKLSEENARYKREYEQYSKDKRELDDDRASMQRSLQLERLKSEAEMAEAQTAESEKLRLALSNEKKEFESQLQEKTKKTNEKQTNQVSKMQSEIEQLKKVQKDIKKDRKDSEQTLKQKIESLECDQRSSRSRVFQLEAELERMKPLVPRSPKSVDFYCLRFRRISESIEDIALNYFQGLPEDMHVLENSSAIKHGIFENAHLSYAWPASTFLRTRAIQAFISSKVMPVIQRQHFAEHLEEQGGTPLNQREDRILDAISNVPSTNADLELSWRLFTFQKLDLLSEIHEGRGESRWSTRPNKAHITKSISEGLSHFAAPKQDELQSKLEKVSELAVTLWQACRQDGCRVTYDYGAPAAPVEGWDLVNFEPEGSQNIPDKDSERIQAQLPSKPTALFPRVTASFSGQIEPILLCKGVALPHTSLAFLASHKEANDVKHEFAGYGWPFGTMVVFPKGPKLEDLAMLSFNDVCRNS